MSSEYDQLVKNWRKVWNEWGEVMDRIRLAFAESKNPSNEDLKLADRLEEQADSALAKIKEFQTTLINRQ